jgi:SAM-dependent methyltransferase
LLAERYLFGVGLEIGALHQPLEVPDDVVVHYVDRQTVADLRHEFPELDDWDMVEADVIDDGELLSSVADGSQDFIIANHFLEHCEDPIGTIRNHLGKLRPGGVLFYAVPDKRYTFDFRRPVTPLDHVVVDHVSGPEGSRREHYDEWTRLVEIKPGEADEQALARARVLEAAAHSIHMHVWTQDEFLRLVLECRERFDESFEIEAAARQFIEFTVVLRKNGPFPPPRPEVVVETAPPAPTPRRGLRQIVGRVRRALRSIRSSSPRSAV